MKKDLKVLGYLIISAFLLYCLTMIVVRIQITQMAYEFERLKNDERSMKEEQMRLKAFIAQKLSPTHLNSHGLNSHGLNSHRLKGQDFAEPEPHQIFRIP